MTAFLQAFWNLYVSTPPCNVVVYGFFKVKNMYINKSGFLFANNMIILSTSFGTIAQFSKNG